MPANADALLFIKRIAFEYGTVPARREQGS